MSFFLDNTIIWMSTRQKKKKKDKKRKKDIFRSFFCKIRFRRTYPVKLQVVSNSSAWQLSFDSYRDIQSTSMPSLWFMKWSGAYNQLVRDDSCSHSSRSASLKQTYCRGAQNKACHGPSHKALHIYSPICPCIFTSVPHSKQTHNTAHQKKRPYTFIATPPQSWPSACSCPACTCSLSAHDGRSPSLGCPQPGEPSWDRAGLDEEYHETGCIFSS